MGVHEATWKGNAYHSHVRILEIFIHRNYIRSSAPAKQDTLNNNANTSVAVAMHLGATYITSKAATFSACGDASPTVATCATTHSYESKHALQSPLWLITHKGSSCRGCGKNQWLVHNAQTQPPVQIYQEQYMFGRYDLDLWEYRCIPCRCASNAKDGVCILIRCLEIAVEMH